MYNALSAVVEEAGIWKGNRKHSHAFLLSPDVYPLTRAQRQELERLGYAIRDCLLGISHVASIAYDQTLNYGWVWTNIRKLLSTGVPQQYHAVQTVNVHHIPQLLKVDLMVDSLGRFKIAEIDGNNKHGLGYSTLGRRFRQSLDPDATSLPGAVSLLSEMIRQLGFGEIKLLQADQERFYVPEFEIARQEFALNGISCLVVSEMDADQEFVREGLFLDLPFLYHRTELYPFLLSGYETGEATFIIPPKPFFGSKGILALIRNDSEDTQIEAILTTFIKPQSLKLVRDYIPETLLVGKQGTGRDDVKQRILQKRYVLKKSVASGMKGIAFSDEPTFETLLSVACNEHMNWILQEEVQNNPHTFSWYDQHQTLRTSGDWYVRITAKYVGHYLADAVVTARRDKAVHGAKDCLQLGTAIV